MPAPTRPSSVARAVALVRAGKPQKQTADDLGIHPVTLPKWIKQDNIDRGGVPVYRRANRQSCARRGDESGSWKPSWPS